MSYGITPYRVSLAKLAAAMGSPSAITRQAVVAACALKAEMLDRICPGPPFVTIAGELLSGVATHDEAGAKYWYAVERFASVLGEFLDNDEWYPADPEIFFEHPVFETFGIDGVKPPLPDDFPVVFVLRASSMTHQLEDELSEVLAAPQFAQFRSWLSEAKSRGDDLVFFYY